MKLEHVGICSVHEMALLGTPSGCWWGRVSWPSGISRSSCWRSSSRIVSVQDTRLAALLRQLRCSPLCWHRHLQRSDRSDIQEGRATLADVLASRHGSRTS